MDFRLEGTRRVVDLLTFMLRSLKAERRDFGGKNRPGAGTLSKLGFHPCLSISFYYKVYKEQSTANSNSFKMAQKTAFEAKRRLYTTGKVIQRLFIIGLYTQLAIYGYR